MQIDVTLKVNEELKSLNASNIQNSELAKGWCEIEGIIKFPVRVLRYKDKIDGTDKMFVSFPQRKNGDKYDEIVHPINKEIRTEVQDAVLKEMKKSLSREVILTSNVTDVKINMLKEPIKTGSITLKAMASITLCGFIINGIQVKESDRGVFIQMPQHKVGNDYRDTVYGSNSLIQQEIKEKVITAYKTMKNQTIGNEQTQSVEEKYSNPLEDMIPTVKEKLIIDKAECTFVDAWKDHHSSYTIGQSIEDANLYFVRFETSGHVFEDGYDHLPTRDEVENDQISRLAQIELDEHEKTFGADGSKVYPNLNNEPSKISHRKPKM